MMAPMNALEALATQHAESDERREGVAGVEKTAAVGKVRVCQEDLGDLNAQWLKGSFIGDRKSTRLNSSHRT